MSLKKFFFIGITLFLLSISGSSVFAAGMLPSQWDQKIQEGANLPHGEGNGMEQFQVLVIDNIVQITRYLLISISIFYIFVDLLLLLFNTGDEGKISEIRKRAGWYMMGFALIGLSSEFVKIFDVAHTNGQIGNIAQAKTTLQYVINYISLIAGTVAIFYMLIAAIRMITAQGDQGAIDKEKKMFQYGFLGLIVILMADVMINKVFYPANVQAPGETEMKTFAQEVFSMASYFLEILSITSIVFIALAGGYYLISLGDDSKTTMAKNILKNLAIGFVMITIAYTVVSAIAPNLAGQVVAH